MDCAITDVHCAVNLDCIVTNLYRISYNEFWFGIMLSASRDAIQVEHNVEEFIDEMIWCLGFVLKDSWVGLGQGGSSMGRLSEYDQILTVVEALGRIQDSLCSYYFCIGLKIIIKSKVGFCFVFFKHGPSQDLMKLRFFMSQHRRNPVRGKMIGK